MTQAVRYDANMAADLASLALYDEEGRILLQHRDANARNSPDHWGFFGGHMEEGETPEEAMRRELMEEIEYAPLNPVFLHEERFVDPSYDPPARRSIFVFLEPFDRAQTLVQHEGQGLGWFLPSETAGLLMTERARNIVAAIERHLSAQH